MTNLRSYLFVTWAGGGNVEPVLGVARRLAERGHTVNVLTEPCLRASVERAGARFIRFTRPPFDREDGGADLVRDWEARTPLGAMRRAFDNLILGPAQVVAEETRRAFGEVSAEVLVADLHMMGALLAAEAAGLPRVVLFHMPEYLPGPGRPAAGPGFLPRSDLLGRLRDVLFERLFYRQLRPYLGPWNDIRRAFGLAPLDEPRQMLDSYHDANLRLIQTSEAFDFPITPPPENVRYVGPVLDDPDWSGDAWESPWPQGDLRPLVVVSLSSTFQDQTATVQRAIHALGDLPVRGLVTLGPAMAKESFDVPSNVITVVSAPHSQVFQEADAVVTHAGHGTVMRGLAHGLPLICLPMGRDQNDNAAKVAARGAGIRLKPSASAARIRDAVQRVLDRPTYRESAERLGGIIREDAAADRATLELEAVATPSRRVRRPAPVSRPGSVA